MKFIKETFLNLEPVAKSGRPKIDGYSDLHLKQNENGYAFQLKYLSPRTGQRRFITLVSFKYGDNINKKMLDNVLKQLVINQGIVAQNIDPLDKKRAEREANKPKKKDKTINDLFNIFSTSREYGLLSDSTREHYERNYNKHVAKYWGKREVSTIKRTQVKSYLENIKQDSIANGVLLSLTQIQRTAIDMELIETPFLFELKARPTGKGDKTLIDREVISLMESSSGWDSLRNIAKMQLLTACRVCEVSGMRWEEIDMKAKTWTIPPDRIKTEKEYKKMKRPHVLPLMPKMSEILLQQRQHGTTGLVFPKYSQSPKAKKKYYKAVSVGFWLSDKIAIKGGTHQLRRTVASRLSEQSGISEYDIKLILNHSVGGVTKVYINSQQIDRKREVLTRWHGYIDSLMEMQKQEAV